MRELELLQHVYATTGRSADRVLIGPGDDMAMLRRGGGDLLAAVDQLVAGRHFRTAATPVALIGRKAVARALSDVAAMAAHPMAALAAVTLPPDFGEDRARELFDAMRTYADEQDCPLVGGDIALHDDPSHPLVCSVTVLATPHAPGPVRRDGARPGDAIYVTGALGGAIASDGGGRHLSFEPRIAEALELLDALGSRLHAMIDISDGLGRDAAHMASASGVRMEIDVARIPRRGDCTWREAAGGGEDYELLFTATGAVPPRLRRDLPVTAVGWVREGPASADEPCVLLREGDLTHRGDDMGWEHAS